jgi:glutamate 5-kinase
MNGKRYHRVTIKIGSNVLTRSDGTLDVTRMSALVDQIAELKRAGIEVILISSGAVACGRSELAHYDLPRMDKVDSRQLFSAVGQVKLMNRYTDLFAGHALKVGQVLTMKENFSTRRHYLNQRNCMSVMLTAGVVPIVNENDTVSVTELMFTDNDELSGLVATMMDCDALIILSNIDGIYNGDPKEPTSQVISTVTLDDDLGKYIQNERSGFGRGGMVTKYRIARKVAEEGIEVVIANGKRERVLCDLLMSEAGVVSTHFVPSTEAISGMKRWMAHSQGFAKGRLLIDAHAAEAVLSDAAVSLLPIGITAVEGDFEKDDLVTIVAPDGTALGIGRVAMSSDEARQAMGKRGQKPMVHYDYMFIEK